MGPDELNTIDELREHPDAIVVVIGMEGLVPYLSCPVRLIRCDVPTFRCLLNDLSALARWDGESHRLELAAPGASYDWDFESGFRVSDSVMFSPQFQPVHAYLHWIIAGDATDLVVAVGSDNPRLLWELLGDQWDQTLYLRLIDAFGALHRRFASDDELIRRSIERDWIDVLRWLATIGARFDQPGPDGDFPLHVAAWHGKLEAVKFILGLGVDPVPRTRHGKSPLDRATFCGHQNRAQLQAILWPLEYPAAAARLAKLDELTRP